MFCCVFIFSIVLIVRFNYKNLVVVVSSQKLSLILQKAHALDQTN